MDRETKLELRYSFSFATFPATKDDLIAFIDGLAVDLGLNTELMVKQIPSFKKDVYDSLDDLYSVQTESDFNFPDKESKPEEPKPEEPIKK
jgi:hypothetical protein